MRKWILTVVFFLLGVLIWYFFFKPYAFSVSFKANALPAIVNQSVKLWSTSQKATLEVLSDGNLNQRLNAENKDLNYQWEIKQLSDTTSQVKIYVTDNNISLYNKLVIPFINTDLEKIVKSNITGFIDLLSDQLKNIKIKIEGPADIPSSYCAYISVKSKQSGKAQGMMENYGLLSTIFVDKNVQLNGKPFIEVTKWDKETDSIYYNFCFPIIQKDSLPQDPKVHYKEFIGGKAIKAIYNGNYMTSDRAWYSLINYAKKNEISVQETPVEIFFNNPNMGGNEIEWVTEVFLPLK